MCFNKAIVQSMFKHAASGNGRLVLILQSRSQIVLVKHIDWNLVELIWTTKWPGDKAFRPVKKFYELRNFTNTNRQNCPKCSFSKSMHRQTNECKNTQESGIFYRAQ